MTKIKFLLELNESLSGLPKDDVEERLSFYSEMIEDRMEDGLSEDDAVAAVGSIDEIAAQITADIPLTKIVKEKLLPKKRLKAWEIVLIILGAPVWASLLVAGLSVIFSLYISLWAVVVSMWSVFGAFAASVFGALAAGGIFLFDGSSLSGIAMLGTALIFAGLSVFSFYGCTALTKGIVVLTKKAVLIIKHLFIRKEGNNE